MEGCLTALLKPRMSSFRGLITHYSTLPDGATYENVRSCLCFANLLSNVTSGNRYSHHQLRSNSLICRVLLQRHGSCLLGVDQSSAPVLKLPPGSNMVSGSARKIS